MPGRKRRPYVYPSHLRHRAPRNGTCRSCGTRILVAYYDAMPRYWDRPALTPVGELDALLRGLRTWHVVGTEVYQRRAHSITEEPAPIYGDIHRDHKCGIPQPAGVAVKEIPKPNKDEPCPF
jgi:hypothetical protein